MIKQRQQLHESIADVLRREILATGKPGDRLPADTEQVKRFGVSIVTVRDALRRLCQEGLLERRHGSGTYVRRRDVNGTILLITPAYALDGQAHYFFNRVLLAIHRQLRAQSFHVQFSIQDAPLPAPAFSMAPSPDLPKIGPDSRIDGAISFLGAGDMAWLESLEQQGIPVVSHADWFKPSHVNLDFSAMITDATEYLVAQGRKRLLFVVPQLDNTKPADWYFTKPFLAVLDRHGIPHNPEWILPINTVDPMGENFARIRTLWQQAEPKPDGLLVGMDTLFAETVMAIVSQGIRVPKDLLVVTHANRGGRIFCPVHAVFFEVDPEDYAATMVELLLKRIRREVSAGQSITLRFRPRGMDEVAALLEEARPCAQAG